MHMALQDALVKSKDWGRFGQESLVHSSRRQQHIETRIIADTKYAADQPQEN